MARNNPGQTVGFDVDMGDIAQQYLLAGPWTLVAHVRWDGAGPSGTNNHIITKGGTGSASIQMRWSIHDPTNDLRLRWRNGGQTVNFTFTPGNVIDTWVVAFCRNSGSGSIELGIIDLDGSIQGTGTGTVTTADGSGVEEVRVGSDGNGANAFHGEVGNGASFAASLSNEALRGWAKNPWSVFQAHFTTCDFFYPLGWNVRGSGAGTQEEDFTTNTIGTLTAAGWSVSPGPPIAPYFEIGRDFSATVGAPPDQTGNAINAISAALANQCTFGGPATTVNAVANAFARQPESIFPQFPDANEAVAAAVAAEPNAALPSLDTGFRVSSEVSPVLANTANSYTFFNTSNNRWYAILQRNTNNQWYLWEKDLTDPPSGGGTGGWSLATDSVAADIIIHTNSSIRPDVFWDPVAESLFVLVNGTIGLSELQRWDFTIGNDSFDQNTTTGNLLLALDLQVSVDAGGKGTLARDSNGRIWIGYHHASTGLRVAVTNTNVSNVINDVQIDINGVQHADTRSRIFAWQIAGAPAIGVFHSNGEPILSEDLRFSHRLDTDPTNALWTNEVVDSVSDPEDEMDAIPILVGPTSTSTIVGCMNDTPGTFRYYRRDPSTGLWDAPTVVQVGGVSFCKIAADSENQEAHIIWRETIGNTIIRVRTDVTTTSLSGQEVLLEDQNQGFSFPQCPRHVVDGGRDLMILGQNLDIPQGVWYRIVDVPTGVLFADARTAVALSFARQHIGAPSGTATRDATNAVAVALARQPAVAQDADVNAANSAAGANVATGAGTGTATADATSAIAAAVVPISDANGTGNTDVDEAQEAVSAAIARQAAGTTPIPGTADVNVAFSVGLANQPAGDGTGVATPSDANNTIAIAVAAEPDAVGTGQATPSDALNAITGTLARQAAGTTPTPNVGNANRALAAALANQPDAIGSGSTPPILSQQADAVAAANQPDAIATGTATSDANEALALAFARQPNGANQVPGFADVNCALAIATADQVDGTSPELNPSAQTAVAGAFARIPDTIATGTVFRNAGVAIGSGVAHSVFTEAETFEDDRENVFEMSAEPTAWTT